MCGRENIQSRFIVQFDSLKKTALSEIAADWDKGQAFKKECIVNEGNTPCIHYGELFKCGPIIDTILSWTNESPIKSSAKGDILFPASDVTPNGLARCSALMSEGVLLGGDIIVLRLKSGFIPEFVSYAINMQKDQLIRRVTGSVVRHISAKSLNSVEIPIPAIADQKQFISIIRQADKSKFIDFKSRFIEMFGNPVTNTKSWPTKALSEAAPESPSTNKTTGLVWVLNLDMVESQSGRVIEKVYDNEKNLNSVVPFDDGNVLFSKLRPYLNKVVIPNGVGYATTELVPLRPDTSIVRKEFLACLLRSNDFVNYADAIATGTKMPRMPMTALRDFKCIIPPISFQDEFIKVSQQADKSKYLN